MGNHAHIEIWVGGSVVTGIGLEYRPWTTDPDPFAMLSGSGPSLRRLPRTSNEDWLCTPPLEARFRCDILNIATGVTSHDVVLTLTGVPHTPGGNPFFRGQRGFGKAEAGFHWSIPGGGGVVWKVV